MATDLRKVRVAPQRRTETSDDLTDNSTGTADGTVEAVSGSGADAAINNNFAEMAAEVNAIKEMLRDAGVLEA